MGVIIVLSNVVRN
jgi:predicted transcriptional regulator